jgi:hypothetical protein
MGWMVNGTSTTGLDTAGGRSFGFLRTRLSFDVVGGFWKEVDAVLAIVGRQWCCFKASE